MSDPVPPSPPPAAVRRSPVNTPLRRRLYVMRPTAIHGVWIAERFHIALGVLGVTSAISLGSQTSRLP